MAQVMILVVLLKVILFCLNLYEFLFFASDKNDNLSIIIIFCETISIQFGY